MAQSHGSPVLKCQEGWVGVTDELETVWGLIYSFLHIPVQFTLKTSTPYLGLGWGPVGWRWRVGVEMAKPCVVRVTPTTHLYESRLTASKSGKHMMAYDTA